MTTSAATPGLLQQHRVIAIACLVMALVVAVYWQSFSRMVGMWSLMNYEHCWLVLPISLFVLWRKREALAASRLKGSSIGVAFTALVVLAWIVARSIGVQAVEFMAASLLIFAAFWAIAGTAAMRKAAFPLLLLMAAVPVGEILVGPLMNNTANIASGLLYLSGVPVFRDGTFLTLPGGSFEVADVCSGLRYLLAGVMASLAFAYVTYAGWGKRALFVAVSAVVLVIANGVRAYVVMFVASATEMRVFGGEDHVIFGMVLFTVVFIALIYVGERYADTVPGNDKRPAATMAAEYNRFPFVMACAALFLVAAGPVFQHVKAQEPVPSVADARLPELSGCRGPSDWTTDWSPEFRGADQVLRGSFTCGEYRGSVYVASYLQQSQGKELINSTNRVWPYDWRRYVDETSVSLPSDSGPANVREAMVRAPDRNMLIWYWYQTGDSVTGSAFQVKLRAAIHALGLRPREASVAAIAIFGEPGADLAAFRDDMEPLARAVMAWNRDKRK